MAEAVPNRDWDVLIASTPDYDAHVAPEDASSLVSDLFVDLQKERIATCTLGKMLPTQRHVQRPDVCSRIQCVFVDSLPDLCRHAHECW